MRADDTRVRGKTVLLWATCLAVVLWPLGCGYHSVSSYLDHIKTINIPDVVNQSDEFRIGDELTEELRSRFGLKWRTGNDALLVVTILDYDIKPLRFDVNNQPEQWRMTIRVDYEFFDTVKNELIARESDFEYYHDFFTVAGRGEEPQDEETARKLLLEKLADTLFYTLAEQW